MKNRKFNYIWLTCTSGAVIATPVSYNLIVLNPASMIVPFPEQIEWCISILYPDHLLVSSCERILSIRFPRSLDVNTRICMQITDIQFEHLSHEFDRLLQDCSEVLISNQLVHKNKVSNVFIRDMKIIESNLSYDGIVTLFHIPTDHTYFFEHPKDHIPGLMIIDAGKQAGTAICHKIYNVDFNRVFILDDINVRFLRLANAGAPLFSYNHITQKKYRRDQLTSLQAEGYFFQECNRVAYMRSSWKIIDTEVFNRFKNK